MSGEAGIGARSNYFSRLAAVMWLSLAQLIRAPSHARRAEAARRSARHVVWLTAILGAAIITLMYALDVREIGLMPPRGTAGLWPFRFFTNFGKAAYVLWVLAVALFGIAIMIARSRGISRVQLIGLGTHLQFLFLAVLVPVLLGEVIKWIVGRGRPFVGGLAAVADGDGGVCRSGCGQPPRAAGASSE